MIIYISGKEIEKKQKLEEAKKKKEREEYEHAKNLTKYISAIKEAAKLGRNYVAVDIGAISNNYTTYQIENIKSELKEFSPEFENCDDYYYDRNYDGDVIDSIRYTKVTVKFKW
jgi:phosphate/sulfate permease